MNRLSLSILAIALIAAAPLTAQVDHNQGERTNPNAPSVAPHSGLTLTGTVDSWNDKEIVLETDTGLQHIVLINGVSLPVNITTGDVVAVDYTRNSQGTMIASEVRMLGATGSEVEITETIDTTVTTPRVDVEVDPDLDADTDVYADVDTTTTGTEVRAGVETDVDGDLDVDANADFEADFDDDEEFTSLPATGSARPLAMLLGLIALAGAASLRVYAS